MVTIIVVLIVIIIIVVLILYNKKRKQQNQQNIAAPPTASTIYQRENDLNLENLNQSSSNPIKNENETTQYQIFELKKKEDEIETNQYEGVSKLKDNKKNEVPTYNKLVQQQ